jgi:hypothetical protein
LDLRGHWQMLVPIGETLTPESILATSRLHHDIPSTDKQIIMMLVGDRIFRHHNEHGFMAFNSLRGDDASRVFIIDRPGD